uniref:B box-type domain-containing protein n=1 Tax=Nelumbo nucifera TaxID=4432 RepID=A0A822YZU6_NELNU|nr:TPA_asm: hypothetical protein HUJ06_008678 [Nelumbo nucifera]
MAIDDESGKGYATSWSLSAKPCDSCKSASALLFCQANSAFLCFNCNAKVHGANKLASRHKRVWICETDIAALCVTCNRDIHSANPLARRHEQIPAIPFYELVASAMKSNIANLLAPNGLLKSSDDDDDRNDKEEDNNTCREEAEAASWLLPNPNPGKLMETPDLKSDDYFFSNVDPYLDLNYGSSMETRYHHHNSANVDSVVPVHTKPPPPPLMNTSDRCFDMGFYRSKPSYGYTTPTISQSVSSSSNAVSDITNPFGRKGGVDAGGGNHRAGAGGKSRDGQVRANTAKVSTQGNAFQGKSVDAVKTGLNGLSSEQWNMLLNLLNTQKEGSQQRSDKRKLSE